MYVQNKENQRIPIFSFAILNKVNLLSLKIITRLAFFLTLLMCAQIFSTSKALAQKVGASGLPLPRFVSLKSKRVNMRVGPGRDYKVQWLYVRKGLPMEIIREFGNWRKVRDPNGNEGWVLHSLLSGKRVSIITPWDAHKPDENKTTPAPMANMHASATQNSAIVAKIEAGTMGEVEECENEWCKLRVIISKSDNITGYVSQSLLWGVYPDETIED